jgi:hypothetical protein
MNGMIRGFGFAPAQEETKKIALASLPERFFGGNSGRENLVILI